MGFKPGNKANPLGRGTETEKQRKNAAMLLSPYAEKAAKRIAKSLDSELREDHQWATNMVMSYVFGKPSQQLDLGENANQALTAVLQVISTTATSEK
jgi:hypothetical protein